jgi:hypothetical protein
MLEEAIAGGARLLLQGPNTSTLFAKRTDPASLQL